jgi:hypothetical protein
VTHTHTAQPEPAAVQCRQCLPDTTQPQGASPVLTQSSSQSAADLTTGTAATPTQVRAAYGKSITVALPGTAGQYTLQCTRQVTIPSSCHNCNDSMVLLHAACNDCMVQLHAAYKHNGFEQPKSQHSRVLLCCFQRIK